MKKILFLATAAAAFVAVPALPSEARDHKNTAESREKLKTVLSHERRAGDMTRDKYRRPAETLAFFGIKPEHTVVEYGPGGGWYTRVLLPYVHGSGKYVAVGTNSDSISFTSRAREARSKSWPERFPDSASEWTGIDAKEIAAFESDEVPEEMKGKVDRIVIFRSLHGMMNRNYADSELRALRELLADDGMIGVVQHRAKCRMHLMPVSKRKQRGYLKQDFCHRAVRTERLSNWLKVLPRSMPIRRIQFRLSERRLDFAACPYWHKVKPGQKQNMRPLANPTG